MRRISAKVVRAHSQLSIATKVWVWAGVVLALIILTQIAYGMTGRARPLMKSQHISIALKTEDQIAKAIHQTYDNAALAATVKDTVLKDRAVVAGIAVDVTRVSDRATDYPMWQWFIPFSLVVGYQYEQKMYTKINDDAFTEYAKKLSPLCAVAPVNASVSIDKEGALKVVPAKDGLECNRTQLYEQFKEIELQPRVTDVAVRQHPRAAAIGTQAAHNALAEAQRITEREVIATLEGIKHPISRNEVASWLSFSSNAASGTVNVTFDEAPMKEYLMRIQKSIYKAPGVTTIQFVDGKETGRRIGASGQGLDINFALKALQAQFKKGDGEVALRLSVLKPKEVSQRSYTKSEKGLEALLNAIVKQKGDYAISVRQLSGPGWSADAAGTKVYTPASTYKLFVAYAVLTRIESGAMKWSDSATSGRTVSACFDTMIIDSDNACAEWFGEKIGWKTITDMLHQAGVSAKTSLYTRGGFVATTSDEALFLTKLYNGSLLSKSSTNRLLNVMKKQVYRSGVPAGAQGSIVADKVGFLNGLLHDAAIVYGPRGVYVVVIFTNGSSWAEIADATRQIHAFLQ